MKTHHTIIIGDCRQMSYVPDQYVQLIITSPPYWQLKDYGDPQQIGFHDTYEDYINNLNLVWQECYRVLEEGCRLCINIGDQFARSVYYGRYKVIPIRTEIIKFCETIGFDYMGAIIWQKVTTCNTTGGATIMGSFPYPRNGILKLDYEFILIFKKPGRSRPVSIKRKEASKLTIEEWNTYFSGHWNFPGERQDAHLAVFPEELPGRLIRMFSFVGDTVLDPFLGSGTTTLAAKNRQRNSIGYEINEQFLPLIKKKIGAQQGDFFDDAEFAFLTSTSQQDWKQRFGYLPYVYKDPVRLNKKIDPKTFHFGSKIAQHINVEQRCLKIKKILSADRMILSDDTPIRLIGIQEDHEKNGIALSFLEQKVKGQPVFLKFDAIKFDSQHNLLCYLYLKNKTFVNAHLLKRNLAKLDLSIDFRYKNRFLKYLERSDGKRMDS